MLSQGHPKNNSLREYMMRIRKRIRKAILQVNLKRVFVDFSAESQDDLCKQVQFALGDQRSKRKRREAESVAMDDTAFTALVAVKCNYDFVWYELGWRYYTAARTTTEYVLEKNDGTFDASCGQIIFIP